MLSKKSTIIASVAMLLVVLLAAPALALNVIYTPGEGTGDNTIPVEVLEYNQIPLELTDTQFTGWDSPDGKPVFNGWQYAAEVDGENNPIYEPFTEELFNDMIDNQDPEELTLVAIWVAGTPEDDPAEPPEELGIGSPVAVIFDPKVPVTEYDQYGRYVVYQNFPRVANEDPVLGPLTIYRKNDSEWNNKIKWINESEVAHGTNTHRNNPHGRWSIEAEYAESLYFSLNNNTPGDPVRPGYRFHGWYLIDDATGDLLVEGENISPQAGDVPYDFKGRPVNDHTYLSALWWKGNFNITYLDNGVDVGADYPTNPKTYTYNKAESAQVTLVRPSPTKPGYGDVNGECPCDPEENGEATGGRRWVLQGTDYEGEEITTVPMDLIERGLGDVVLVADYKPCIYYVSFYNGQEQMFDFGNDRGLLEYTVDSPRALPGPANPAIVELLDEDYKFGGWYLDSNLTQGPIRTTPQVTAETECVTPVYLKLVPVEYNITYHLGADDATNPVANPKTYTKDSNINLLAAQRPGYFFSGWLLDNVEEQYIGRVTADLDEYLIIDDVDKYRDIDLYAVWSDKMVRIIYMDIDIKNSLSLHDTNGILTGPFQERTDLSPKTYDVSRTDTKLPVPAAPINQADIGAFNFLGWYLNEDWTTEILNSNETGQYLATNGILGDVTVYAKWEFANDGDGYGIITYIPKNGENACEPGSPIWQEVVRDGAKANNYGNYNEAILQPGDAPMTRVTQDGRTFEFVGWNLAEPYERDGYCARVSQMKGGCEDVDCMYNFNSYINENITLGGSWKLVSVPEEPEEPCDPCNPCDPKPKGIVFQDADGDVITVTELTANGELPEVEAPYIRGKVFIGWQVRGLENNPDAEIPADAFVYPVYRVVPDLTGDGKANIADVIALLQYSSTGEGALKGKTLEQVIAMGADFNNDGAINMYDVVVMLRAI